MTLEELQKYFDAARMDQVLQNALLECELWAAEALAVLSRQSEKPFTQAEFLASVRHRNVPATPAYHPVQIESVLRRPRRGKTSFS